MRAEFQSGYLWRYAGLAAVSLGLAAWFAYDGFVGYPKELEKAVAFESLEDLSAMELEEQWAEITEEKGWSLKQPKPSEEIESDINGQYFWCAIGLVVGIPALLLLIRSRGTWVESTGSGIKTSWGQEFSYADVESLNKRRWEKKGIARATYKTDQGTKIFTFDDFKYEREPLGKMLRELEAVLTPEQITGGPTEVETDALKAKAAEEEEASKTAAEDPNNT
jgi:hypothetical protein